jgi:hypothetical protein
MKTRMCRGSICLMAGLLCGSAVLAAEGSNGQAIPNFAPDDRTSWFPDRPTGDDYLPPPSGPGPVLADPAHPYVPNDEGRNTGVQPTYRIADLTNPILQPWAREQMKKSNDEVLAGGVPFIARERCWPAGVPTFDIMRRVAPVWVVQAPKEVLLIWPSDQQVRHVYLNVPHSVTVKPSWYGESVGHYEGDELVVDTIGLNDKTFVDNYRTPHSERLHVVERFKLIEGAKTLQVGIEVEDPGAFNMKWHAVQRFKRWTEGPMAPSACAENNFDYFAYKVEPIPQASKPDF